MRKSVIPLIFLVMTMVMTSCLSQDQIPGPGPKFETELTVDTGFTYGEMAEGETSTFTLHWTARDAGPTRGQ